MLTGLWMASIPKPPEWLGCCCGVPVFFLGVGALTLALQFGFEFGNKARNLSHSIADVARLRDLIKDSSPYLLYLRPFDSERNDRVVNTAPYTELIEEDMMREQLERDMARGLLPELRDLVPRVAFLNPVGGRSPYCDLQIDLLGADWFTEFELAAASALVILVGSGDGEDHPSFRKEIDLLIARGWLDRVLVMSNTSSHLLSAVPELRMAKWIVHGPTTSARLPEDLLALVRGAAAARANAAVRGVSPSWRQRT
ncbi:MAG: hypothetical protein ACKVZJ_06350 [Phycisphaerales bacterium]